jgi:hypothetical protein
MPCDFSSRFSRGLLYFNVSKSTGSQIGKNVDFISSARRIYICERLPIGSVFVFSATPRCRISGDICLDQNIHCCFLRIVQRAAVYAGVRNRCRVRAISDSARPIGGSPAIDGYTVSVVRYRRNCPRGRVGVPMIPTNICLADIRVASP